MDEMDKFLLSTDDIQGKLNEWANTHDRIPYQSQNQYLEKTE